MTILLLSQKEALLKYVKFEFGHVSSFSSIPNKDSKALRRTFDIILLIRSMFCTIELGWRTIHLHIKYLVIKNFHEQTKLKQHSEIFKIFFETKVLHVNFSEDKKRCEKNVKRLKEILGRQQQNLQFFHLKITVNKTDVNSQPHPQSINSW